MFRVSGVRWQVALVVALFLGSLGVLLVNVLATLNLPQQELQARSDLEEAGRRMAEAAAPIEVPMTEPVPDLKALNKRLRAITREVLQDYPGIEGGFYLDSSGGLFAGYAYPTNPHAHPETPLRNEPPPLEAPLIQKQLESCLDKGTSVLRSKDVETSRVVLFTRPVGKDWPDRRAVWLMYRLTGPEQLQRQLHWHELSIGLALGGIALSLVLTANLGRTLRRQRIEQERLRDELRRAEHLAALGKLLAGVAHEVRNPLAGIRSTVQLWNRLPDESRTPESMAAVVSAVDRLNAIVTSLLFFARADSAERLPVDVNRILGEGLDLIAAQAAGQGVTLERDFSPSLAEVPGSANALRQVALNLLTNALQAMPGGGRLRCGTRRLPGGAVEIRISDTGPGITEEARKHLFEPFFTTRPEGTGLGLAICREIVQAHGGKIDLKQTGPEGTTFCIELPV